jgi:hypothetical protein
MGVIDGKAVQFQYINFEKWSGSNDNVLNFSVNRPEQDCGFIENFTGFTLVNKGGSITQGEWVKAKFADDPGTYKAYYRQGEQSSTAEWDCALSIESINDKTVTGKIALYFNDEKNSRVAGKFEALVCNN